FFPTVTLNASVGFEGTGGQELARVAQPLLGDRAGDQPDAVRRRPPPRDLRGGPGPVRRHRRRVPADHAQRPPAGRGQPGDPAHPRTGGRATAARRRLGAAVPAELSLQIFTTRYRGGLDTYLQVITAQTTALSNERNDVDIRRRRMSATVLLIKALGGTWRV